VQSTVWASGKASACGFLSRQAARQRDSSDREVPSVPTTRLSGAGNRDAHVLDMQDNCFLGHISCTSEAYEKPPPAGFFMPSRAVSELLIDSRFPRFHREG